MGRASLAGDAAVYAVEPHGLVLRAAGGSPAPPGPEEERAAREDLNLVKPGEIVIQLDGREGSSP